MTDPDVNADLVAAMKAARTLPPEIAAAGIEQVMRSGYAQACAIGFNKGAKWGFWAGSFFTAFVGGLALWVFL